MELAWWTRDTVPDLPCEALLVLPPPSRRYPEAMRRPMTPGAASRAPEHTAAGSPTYELPVFAQFSAETQSDIDDLLDRSVGQGPQDWRLAGVTMPGGYGEDDEPVQDDLPHPSILLVLEEAATGQRTAVLAPAAPTRDNLPDLVLGDFARLVLRATMFLGPVSGSPTSRAAGLLHAALMNPRGWFGAPPGPSEEPGAVTWRGLGLSAEEALLCAASGFASSHALNAFLEACDRPAGERPLLFRLAEPTYGQRHYDRRLGGIVDMAAMDSWMAWWEAALDPAMPESELATWAAATATWGPVAPMVDRQWLRERADEGWSPSDCLSLVMWFVEQTTGWSPKQPVEDIKWLGFREEATPSLMAAHALRWAALTSPRDASLWLDAGYDFPSALALIRSGQHPGEKNLRTTAALRRM